MALDDKRGTWRLVVQYGGYYRVGPRVESDLEAAVAEKLERRSACQAEENYEEADAIHVSRAHTRARALSPCHTHTHARTRTHILQTRGTRLASALTMASALLVSAQPLRR